MPEATGFVVVKPNKTVKKDWFDREARNVDIERFCAIAGIKDFHGKYSVSEGVQSEGGFFVFSPFGQEWMLVLEAITKSGTGVELYGVMQDEYGLEQVYILNASGQSLCLQREVDIEDDDDESAVCRSNTKIEKYFPKPAQKCFPSEEKNSILFAIGNHLASEKRKKDSPLCLEHEGFRYKLFRHDGGYCSITRENCNGTEEGNVDWGFECVSQAKEEIEATYGLPAKLWAKAQKAL